jgi:hypothetical protein
VGSGNLTRRGLETNEEAAVVLEGHAGDDSAAETVLKSILAWTSHPAAQLVTPEVAIAFAEEAAPPASGVPVGLVPPIRHDASKRCFLSIGSDRSNRIPGGRICGMPTGFAEFDALTNGLQPGTLTVIGRRPSLGKSVLLLDFCRSAAIKHNLPAALFSLETTSDEINMRLLSAEVRVPLHAMRTGLMGRRTGRNLCVRWPRSLQPPST